MDAGKIAEIKKELNECAWFRDEKAKKVLQILKRDSKTYKDVEAKLNLTKKNFSYSHDDSEKFKDLIERIEKLLEEEKSDLPVTNHFNRL